MVVRISLTLLVACYTFVASAADQTRNGPKPLRGGDHQVGTLAPATNFQDLANKSYNLARLAKDHRAVVVVMTSTSCPMSQSYFPTLAKLSTKYMDKNVLFLLVNSESADEPAAMQKAQQQLGDNAIYVFDRTGKLAKAIGAKTTTEVFVINQSRTIAYHGAVDDQFGFGYTRPAPQEKYLSSALDAILKNERPAIEATTAPGCSLNIRRRRHTTSDVNYYGRISRLMNRHCVRCHRDGGVAPFVLDTFDDVVAHAPMMREVVDRGTMPPWFAATDSRSKISPWANDASLSSNEMRDLMAWIQSDQKRGDPADAPEPLDFAGSWSIGQPDVVYEFPKAVPIPATGVLPYEHIVVETDFPEDKWVQKVEILPGNPSVVHHVLVYIIQTEMTIKNPLNYWAVYTPGQGAQEFPEGYARRLPKGARIMFQMHYTPNGTTTEDKSRIGLRFANRPPENEVKTASVINGRFEIPPGAKRYKVEAELKLPVDVEILGLLPHSHLRGIAARYELISPAGDKETLLDVPGYDFNWQLYYQYAKRPIFPKDSTIRYTAWYDNSEDNPANPDPTATVRWGEQTTAEMHLGYVQYAEPLDADWRGKFEGLREQLFEEFEDLDRDESRGLSIEEFLHVVPDWAPATVSPGRLRGLFRLIDGDRSGQLNEAEFKLILGLFR